MTLRCQLCGGTQFREEDQNDPYRHDGLWCVNCGASMGGPPDPGGGEDNLRDLPLERVLDNENDAMLLAERFGGWG